MLSAYEILAGLWRDNQAEIDRMHFSLNTHEPMQIGHVNGLSAANQRIRAAMAGLPRSPVAPPQNPPGWHGGGDNGGPVSPPHQPQGGGKVIDAVYDVVPSPRESVAWEKPS